VRGQRARAYRSAALVAIGLTAAAIARWGPVAVSPGRVSPTHAAITSGCADCHPKVGGEAGTASAAADLASEADRACLKCHVIGHRDGIVHSVPAEQLASLTRETEPAPAGGLSVVSLANAVLPEPRRGALHCATCHTEHHGAAALHQTAREWRCQACHRNQFDDFVGEHPELGDHPERAAIAFDHRTHARSHFPKSEATFQCSRCHAADARGAAMALAPFEAACGSCHARDVRGDGLLASQRGIVFLERGVAREAHGAFAALMGALDSPSTSPSREAPQTAGESGALAAREAPAPDALLRRDGMPGVASRLRALLGRRIPEATLDEIASDPPAAAVAVWLSLPSPSGERGSGPCRGGAAALAAGFLQDSGPGSWWLQADDCTLRYRARGHADPLLRAWLDVAALLDSPRQGESTRHAARALQSGLLDERAPGRCGMCHVAEADPASPATRWRALSTPEPAQRFLHATHVPLLAGRDGCFSCHRPSTHAASADASAASSAAIHGFEPIAKAACASCHDGARAPDDCTTCHRFHWNAFGSRAYDADPAAFPAPEKPEPEPAANAGDDLLSDGDGGTASAEDELLN
jgi:hypothetical protein